METALDLKGVIYKRRAVRECTSQQVKEEVLRQLIDGAIQAHSAVN
jgi:nitroreductase